MHAENIVSFTGYVPDENQILAEVKRISGLHDLKWNEHKTEFVHPDFKKLLFDIFVEGKTIRILRGWDEPSYLLDVTLTALVNLGGTYESPIPENGKLRWSDAKDKYPEPLDYTEFSNHHIEAEITFEGVPPSPDEIANKVSELSGVSGISARYMNHFHLINHESFVKNRVFMAQADHRVVLFGKGHRPNYMLEITIASLVSLGGHYTGELSNWTSEKWEKVKSLYPNQ